MDATQPIAQQEPADGQPWPLVIEIDPADRTPVFGTATPTSGLPRLVRSLAYRYPPHGAAHWLLLLVADRLASAGVVLDESITPGQQGLVIRHFRRQIIAHPAGTVAMAAAPLAIVGGFLALRQAFICPEPQRRSIIQRVLAR